MYNLMAAISVFIRQFYLPNPFDSLEKEMFISIWETPIPLSSNILNWVVEPFMHVVTFEVVGLYYKSGSNPVWGSFLYLLFYFIHTVLLGLISATGFAVWAIILIGGLYVGFHIVLGRLRDLVIF